MATKFITKDKKHIPIGKSSGLKSFQIEGIGKNLGELELQLIDVRKALQLKRLKGDKATGELESTQETIGGARNSILNLVGTLPEDKQKEIHLVSEKFKNDITIEGSGKPQNLTLIPHRTGDENFGTFDSLQPKDARTLLTGYPNIDPEDRQNNSPTARTMVALAEAHDGTLGGHFVGENDSSRDDHRITLESMILKFDTIEEAKKIQNQFNPDEFDDLGNNKYRYWWD